MKRLELNEPRESLKKEVASLREQVRQLINVNDAKEADLSSMRDKLASIHHKAVATYEDVKKLKFCKNFSF